MKPSVCIEKIKKLLEGVEIDSSTLPVDKIVSCDNRIEITNVQLLCQFYFEIAEEFIDAEEIQKKLDKKIKHAKQSNKYKIIKSN